MLELCSGTQPSMTLLELSVDKENILSSHFSKTVLNKNLFRSILLRIINSKSLLLVFYSGFDTESGINKKQFGVIKITVQFWISQFDGS